MERTRLRLSRDIARQCSRRNPSVQRRRQFNVAATLRQSLPQPQNGSTRSALPQTTHKKIIAPSNALKNPDDLSKGDTFTPAPLVRPIGYPYPPNPADNLPHDLRTKQQKREDFKNYDKHLEKRQKMIKEIARPYFRDFTNMQYAEGKIFVANQRLWKKDLSLYWPNLWGWDVKRKGAEACTTDVFRGVVNVVCVFSRTWAERQIDTFVDEDVKTLIQANKDVAQLVEINIEEQKLTRMILWAYAGSLRKRKSEDWQQYLVMKNIPTEAREVLGMLNYKAGYVFLVDASGKIRWAGSGDAWEGEKEWLLSGITKLIQQEKELKASKNLDFANSSAIPSAATASA